MFGTRQHCEADLENFVAKDEVLYTPDLDGQL